VLLDAGLLGPSAGRGVTATVLWDDATATPAMTAPPGAAAPGGNRRFSMGSLLWIVLENALPAEVEAAADWLAGGLDAELGGNGTRLSDAYWGRAELVIVATTAPVWPAAPCATNISSGEWACAAPSSAAESASIRRLVPLGLYPIATSQHSSTTLCQVSYHIY
jgi:hypothetical protein